MSLRAAIRTDGFVLLPGAVPRARIAAVRAAVAAPFRGQLARLAGAPAQDEADPTTLEAGMRWLFAQHRQRFLWCGKHAQHALALHRLAASAELESLVRQAGLGAPSICTRPVVYFNHPDLAVREVYWKVPAHQDWRSMQASLDSVVIWVPLVDVPDALGPLEVVPGSHRAGLIAPDLTDGFGQVPPDALPGADWRAVPVEAGDLLLFSSFLVHRSGTNVSARFRWSCHFRYTNLDEPVFADQGYPHPYTYRPEPPMLFEPVPAPAQIQAAWDDGADPADTGAQEPGRS